MNADLIWDMRFSASAAASDGPTNSTPAQKGSSTQATAVGAHSAAGGRTTEATTAATKAAEATAPGAPRIDPEVTAAAVCGRPAAVQRRTRRRRCPSCRREVIVDWEQLTGARDHLKGGGGGDGRRRTPPIEGETRPKLPEGKF